jgi:HD-GYP domain-containing protein (c-di-GMP phosphodiesterase class II)
VTECALLIARELGFSASDCEDLHRAGLLHDLGKVSIPAEILNKPGKLTDEEFALIQTHPGEAERIIEPIHVFANIRPIVRQHHERWDGKGYPDGLKGEEIHPAARILAVADVYDALYSDRPYRDGWPHEKVLNYLKLEAGSAFDPVAVKGLIRSIQKKAV